MEPKKTIVVSPTQENVLLAENEFFSNLTRCEEPFTGNPRGLARELAIEILIDRLEPLAKDWCYEF